MRLENPLFYFKKNDLKIFERCQKPNYEQLPHEVIYWRAQFKNH
jgi:hypothetical protein